jgi:hypothetical protein
MTELNLENCCAACQNAASHPRDCECSCGGVGHGINVQPRLDLFFPMLDDETRMVALEAESIQFRANMGFPDHDAPLSTQDYEDLSDDECPTCGAPLSHVKGYSHEGGWDVRGFARKQWLYRTCPKCRYDWALWKIGVSR